MYAHCTCTPIMHVHPLSVYTLCTCTPIAHVHKLYIHTHCTCTPIVHVHCTCTLYMYIAVSNHRPFLSQLNVFPKTGYMHFTCTHIVHIHQLYMYTNCILPPIVHVHTLYIYVHCTCTQIVDVHPLYISKWYGSCKLVLMMLSSSPPRLVFILGFAEHCTCTPIVHLQVVWQLYNGSHDVVFHSSPASVYTRICWTLYMYTHCTSPSGMAAVYWFSWCCLPLLPS